MTRPGGHRPRRLPSRELEERSKKALFAFDHAFDRMLGRVASAATLAALIALTPGAAIAGAFDVNDTTWEGCSEFLEVARTELGPARVQTVAVLDWSEVTPEDGVIALHPLQAMDAEETTAFMKAGGRLAIVDDYGRGEETLTRFKIDRIPPPTRPVEALRNRPSLAIAEPVIDVVAGHSVGPHPVVGQVQRLVTNHPTGLRHPNLSPVLRIRAIGEPDVIVAVAGQVGKGRLFAMSDPSALINQMLRYPGNRAFVAGLARYLVDDDGQKRRRGRLFIVANRFDEQGSFGGETTLGKEVSAELKAIANALEEARQTGLPGWVLILFAAIMSLGLAIWVGRSSAKPYKSPLPRYARPTPLVAQGGAAGRLAVLAAPSSPRSLAMLELKSALIEALSARFNLAAEPSPDHLLRIVRRESALDEGSHSALKEVLATMQRVEASMVAGRPVTVSMSALTRAAEVVRKVLRACGAESGEAPEAPDDLHAPAQRALTDKTAVDELAPEPPNRTSTNSANTKPSQGERAP
jgi:hypothetical protein